MKATLVGVKDEQEVVNTLYIEGTEAAPSRLDCLAVALGVNAWAEAEVLPLVSSDYRLLRVEVRSLAVLDGPVAETTPIGPGTGERITPSSPNNVSMAISFRTGLSGRSHRGRNYWPVIAELDTVGQNELTVGAAASILAAYADLQTFVQAELADARHVVLSTVVGGVPRLVGLVTAVTNYLFTDLTLDSMRRRLPGRGI